MDAKLPLRGAVAWPTLRNSCHTCHCWAPHKHTALLLASSPFRCPGGICRFDWGRVLPSALMLGGRARPRHSNFALPWRSSFLPGSPEAPVAPLGAETLAGFKGLSPPSCSSLLLLDVGGGQDWTRRWWRMEQAPPDGLANRSCWRQKRPCDLSWLCLVFPVCSQNPSWLRLSGTTKPKVSGGWGLLFLPPYPQEPK